MSANYALAEGSERGFKQLAGQKKSAVAINYGDAVAYVRATDQWEPAVAASVRPLGFCGELVVQTQSLNVLTGVTTSTRGAAAADTHMSVIVTGMIKRVSDGVIPPGEYVMLSATAPLTEVKVWDGVSGMAVVGRYVRNITQHDNMALAASADNDQIIIDMVDNVPETGTGA